MYVVFDSNIWISELGLNSPKGTAARFFIHNKNAIVALPEVIELETARHLRSRLSDWIADLKKKHEQLLVMFGTLKEIVLPGPEDIDHKVAEVFRECKVRLKKVRFTLKSARSSFLKTIDHQAPSDKNQQFKDGVMWADCMHLLETDDVYLVTADKAFYKDRAYEKGIAPSLSQEAAAHPHTLSLFPDITDFLKSIAGEVEFDKDALVEEFRRAANESINRLLSQNGFDIVGQPAVELGMYATEMPNKLCVEFQIVYSCEDITPERRFDAQLILKGDCYYLPTDQRYEHMRNYGEKLIYKTQDGEEKSKGRIVIFAASFVIGHKSVERSVKYKLS